jgi:hypothetical protein
MKYEKDAPTEQASALTDGEQEYQKPASEKQAPTRSRGDAPKAHPLQADREREEAPIGRVMKIGRHSAKAECSWPNCNWAVTATHGPGPQQAIQEVTEKLAEHHTSAHGDNEGKKVRHSVAGSGESNPGPSY